MHEWKLKETMVKRVTSCNFFFHGVVSYRVASKKVDDVIFITTAAAVSFESEQMDGTWRTNQRVQL